MGLSQADPCWAPRLRPLVHSLIHSLATSHAGAPSPPRRPPQQPRACRPGPGPSACLSCVRSWGHCGLAESVPLTAVRDLWEAGGAQRGGAGAGRSEGHCPSAARGWGRGRLPLLPVEMGPDGTPCPALGLWPAEGSTRTEVRGCAACPACSSPAAGAAEASAAGALGGGGGQGPARAGGGGAPCARPADLTAPRLSVPTGSWL